VIWGYEKPDVRLNALREKLVLCPQIFTQIFTDAKNYISDRYLKKLENEGFVQRLMGR
jgi:hypothetical protein